MATEPGDLTKEQLVRKLNSQTKDELADVLASHLSKDDLVSVLSSKLKRDELAKIAEQAGRDRQQKQAENKQRDSMNEMIQDGLVPDIQHTARFECRSQAMRPERSQRHCEEAKHSRNSDVHHSGDRRTPTLAVCSLRSIRTFRCCVATRVSQ